jgi:branched-subunit amino acid aminotransferase/4-amino-4-deoxychorismate lyase
MSGVFVNGVLGAGLPGDDPGFTRGLNVFDTVRTYGDHPFRLSAHLERLEASANALEIPFPGHALLQDEIRALSIGDRCIRIALTAGGNRVITWTAIDEDRVGRPVSLASVVTHPNPYLPAHVKHGSRAGWVLAARSLGVDEVVFVTPEGNILEANRSNIFAVVDGVVRTPPLGKNLPGVTRGAMLDAAARGDLPFSEDPLPLATCMDELYVSSTLKELSPVTELDGRIIGGGPIGARLLEAFRAIVAEECCRTAA